VEEETGLTVARLYNVCVLPFYLHRTSTIEMAIAFAAVVENEDVVLSREHDAFVWLSVQDALHQLHWPRDVDSLRAASRLLRGGDSGALEDVLRVK
jgi:8-oxo-dGTP pyrophosphatase MutT (NUDIX family)